LRSNISLPKAISQIPQGIYFVEKGSDCITIRAFFWQGHKDLFAFLPVAKIKVSPA